MRNLIGTCRGCEDRHPACHDTCERYQKRKAECDEFREYVRKQKASELYLYKIDSISESKARKNKRNLQGYVRNP